MTAPVHLAGMGWLGSVIAGHLDRAGIPFTWYDPDDEVRAWPACTGLVYPAGDRRSTDDLATWHQWLADPWWPDTATGAAAPHTYVYAHKNPPHAGNYHPAADLGWCRTSPTAAVQVDAPAIIHATRDHHAATRLDHDRPDAPVHITAHGFAERLHRFVWGWTTVVNLETPPDLAEVITHPPTFYSRLHRFQITYAYAIPTRPGWYWAGSNLIVQQNPRDLDPGPFFDRWLNAWHQTYPTVPVVGIAETLTGWRPRGAPTDDLEVHTATDTGHVRITVPPLWHSGVRWSPGVATATLAATRNALGLPTEVA